MEKQLPKIVNFILGLLMIIIMGICFWGTGAEYAYKKVFALPNAVYALLGLCVIAGVCVVSRAIGGMLKKSKYASWIMAGLSLLFFGALVVLSYHYYFKTGWDAQRVHWAAEAIAWNDWVTVQNKYFSYCPNNVFLTFLFSLPIRLGAMVGINNTYLCIIIFQCFLFACAGYFVYSTANILLDGEWAFCAWVLYVLMAGLSPWVVVPYSDATGLFFPILLVWLYLKMRRSKCAWVYLMVLTFICYIGYSIKPQIIIVGIAMLLLAVASLTRAKMRKWRTAVKGIVGGIIGLLIGSICVSACVKATHLELDEELTFGLPHYFMLGLNEEYGGVINIVDQDFSMSFDSVEERNAANWDVALDRLQDLGVGGLLTLWKNKTLTNFADGTFAWWQEGGFYAQEMYEGIYNIRSILTSYFYETGSRHEWFKNYSQTLWMGLLVLVTIAAFRRKEGMEESVLKLAIVGLILFEMIFEARARYLFTYVPVFVLLACMGLDSIRSKVTRMRKGNEA